VTNLSSEDGLTAVSRAVLKHCAAGSGNDQSLRRIPRTLNGAYLGAIREALKPG